MAKNVRRRGRRRRRSKRKNWFTRLKNWQKALVCFAGFMVCLFGSAAIYVAVQWSKIDTRDIQAEDLIINEEVQARDVDLGEGYTNIALFGVDSRDGNLGEGNRTDTIIVASLNNETKEIRMVSVYRDTVLNLSDGTYQKCNAAYSYGGPTMAINMLNTNLDLDIEDYVNVDFGAISDVIDLLGGVEITLEEEEIEPFNKYVTETARVAGKEAHQISEPGTYLLDGPQATTYARIRSTAGGDFTRTERQRLVIEKAVEKIQKADLLTINRIINEVFPQISTSFTLQEILYYAQAYPQYKLLENTGFPFDKSTDNISGLGSVVIAENLTSNVKQLHEFLFGVTDYTPSSTVTANNEGIIAATGYSSGYVTDYDVYDGSYAGDSDESYNDYDSYDSYSYGGYEDETYSRDDWEDEESYGNTETYEDGYDSSQDEEQWSSGGETGTGEDSGSGDGYGESEVSSDSQEE